MLLLHGALVLGVILILHVVQILRAVLNVIRFLILRFLARIVLINVAAAVLARGRAHGIAGAVHRIARAIQVRLVLLLGTLIQLALAAAARSGIQAVRRGIAVFLGIIALVALMVELAGAVRARSRIQLIVEIRVRFAALVLLLTLVLPLAALIHLALPIGAGSCVQCSGLIGLLREPFLFLFARRGIQGVVGGIVATVGVFGERLRASAGFAAASSRPAGS